MQAARAIGIGVPPSLLALRTRCSNKHSRSAAIDSGEVSLWVDSVAKVVLHWWLEILRAADVLFV
jgi:hypothetical protein